MIRVGVLTVSDRVARGAAADMSGKVVVELAATLPGAAIAKAAVVPDERDQIGETLRAWSDEDGLDLILTTGGTGVAPRDVTPDATFSVVDRDVPGIAEAMRAATLSKTPLAMLSRAAAGTRGATLIVNLPGSPKGARECLEVILPVLPHAVELLRGEPSPHTTAG